MENSCRKLAKYLYTKELIEKEDIEDLRFLIELIITQLITFISLFIIGLFFMDFFSVFVICISFVIGRKYLGGYHAKTFSNCYILTILNFIIAILTTKIVIKIEIFYILGIILSIYLLIRYKYNKIIVYNLGYILLVLLFLMGLFIK